jgi:hypothetical protein
MHQGINDVRWGTGDVHQGIFEVQKGIADVRLGIDELQEGSQEAPQVAFRVETGRPIV